MISLIFWAEFWHVLLKQDPPKSAQIINLAKWRKDHSAA